MIIIKSLRNNCLGPGLEKKFLWDRPLTPRDRSHPLGTDPWDYRTVTFLPISGRLLPCYLASLNLHPRTNNSTNSIHYRCFLQAGFRLVNVLIIIGNIFRFAYTSSHIRHKPGRQVVTFLIVCNLAMWMVNMLETNR